MGSAEHDAFSPGSPNERESNERLFSLVCIYYWIYISWRWKMFHSCRFSEQMEMCRMIIPDEYYGSKLITRTVYFRMKVLDFSV